MRMCHCYACTSLAEIPDAACTMRSAARSTGAEKLNGPDRDNSLSTRNVLNTTGTSDLAF